MENDGHEIPFDALATDLRTRAKVESVFEVKNGIIVTPGKFQGEAVYVPYFWEKALEGWADDEPEEGTYRFLVFPEDVKEFPELGSKRAILIREREDGFVYEL